MRLNINRFTLGSVWTLKNLVERKKFGEINFFSCVWFRKNHKEKKYVGKLGWKIVKNKW